MRQFKIVLTFLILVFVSISFAQNEPMKKKSMMKDSSDKKMMMQEDKMMEKDKMMHDNEMMHDDMMMKIYTEDGVAIEGYDPVAYFEMGKPMMGSETYSYEWMDAEWHFTSKDNMMMFKENPEKYAPKYGGHCAFAASEGYIAPVDPEAWTIHDGKLYLNYSSGVSEKFKKNLEERIMKADKNWNEGNLEEK